MPGTVTERQVRIRGLRELTRAFDEAGPDARKSLKETLIEAAEPVRSTAEQLAADEIRNLAPEDRWTLMRSVVTTTRVYVAPVERGRRTRARPQIARPNLADLLMDRAMQPALDEHVDQITEDVEDMLDGVARRWEVR